MKCPKCGATNVEDADFCSLCYTSFKEKTSSPKEAEEKKEPQEIKEKPISTGNLPDGSQGQAKVEIIKKLRKKKIDFQLNVYYPALISVIGAIIISLFIPKNVPLFVESGNKPILVIILTAFCGGWVVMSKYDPLKVKRLLTGFFIGVSTVFFGYIITIIMWISVIRSNPTLFTKYSFDNAETIILPLLLSIGIAVFDQVEDFKFKPFFIIGATSFFGGIMATILGRIVPFIHSFVFVGLICWILIPITKRLFPKILLIKNN